MGCNDILLVEDDPDIRDILQEMLETEGFHVVAVADGRQALARLTPLNTPCLILLDLRMPVMNGWEFLEMLKSRHGHGFATIPVAVVPAAADFADVGMRYRCPVLQKPVDLQRLLSLARQHCHAGQ